MTVTKIGDSGGGAASLRSGKELARTEHPRARGVGSGANAKGKCRPMTGLMRLGRRKALGMDTKAQDYLASARYCEDMAAMAGGHKVSADFAELARQWRELARQRQDFKKAFEQSLPDPD